MTTDRALVDLLHEALDGEDVAGPFQRLQLEIEKSTGASIRRRTRRAFMTRQRLALLAAALVVVVAAGVLMGTRIYNSTRPTTGVPAGNSEVSTLLARPLHLQHFASTEQCLDGPFTSGNYGTGPVFGVSGSSQDTNWGTYWNVGLDVPMDLSGPIVLRGQDVVKGWPMVIVGQYGAGPVYGRDVIGGQTVTQYTAGAIDTMRPPPDRDGFNGTMYIQWRWLQGFKHGWSGCVGFQVDGTNFAETFYGSGATT